MTCGVIYRLSSLELLVCYIAYLPRTTSQHSQIATFCFPLTLTRIGAPTFATYRVLYTDSPYYTSRPKKTSNQVKMKSSRYTFTAKKEATSSNIPSQLCPYLQSAFSQYPLGFYLTFRKLERPRGEENLKFRPTHAHNYPLGNVIFSITRTRPGSCPIKPHR